MRLDANSVHNGVGTALGDGQLSELIVNVFVLMINAAAQRRFLCIDSSCCPRTKEVPLLALAGQNHFFRSETCDIVFAAWLCKSAACKFAACRLCLYRHFAVLLGTNKNTCSRKKNALSLCSTVRFHVAGPCSMQHLTSWLRRGICVGALWRPNRSHACSCVK